MFWYVFIIYPFLVHTGHAGQFHVGRLDCVDQPEAQVTLYIFPCIFPYFL